MVRKVFSWDFILEKNKIKNLKTEFYIDYKIISVY